MNGNYNQVVRTVLSPVKYVALNQSSDPVTVVAAVPGKRICVLGAYATTPTTITVTFYSGPTSNNKPLSGAIIVSSAAPLQLQPTGHPDVGWMATDSGEALVMDPSITNVLKGVLIYCEVDA